MLLLALAGTGWAAYDASLRLKTLNMQDQQFNFGSSSISGSVTSEDSLEGVIRQHLFGVIPVPVKAEKKVVEPPKVVNAPKTKLNLILTGIISSSGSGPSFVMIEISRGETGLVALGNNIGKTGATLHAIESDHILINRGGVIEKLSLERNQLGLDSVSSVESMTVKEVALSAAELSVLSEVGQVSTNEFSNPLLEAEKEQEFSDESFIQSELAGQDEIDDEEVAVPEQ
jgi:type II secretory pathway component PulC